MKKSKIIVDPFVLKKISDSNELTNTEKIHYLRYIWYLTKTERRELAQIV